MKLRVLIGISIDIILNLFKNEEKHRIKTLIIFLLSKFKLALSFYITILVFDFLSPIVVKSKI